MPPGREMKWWISGHCQPREKTALPGCSATRLAEKLVHDQSHLHSSCPVGSSDCWSLLRIFLILVTPETFPPFSDQVILS